jgi:hypothetical protein
MSATGTDYVLALATLGDMTNRVDPICAASPKVVKASSLWWVFVMLNVMVLLKPSLIFFHKVELCLDWPESYLNCLLGMCNN